MPFVYRAVKGSPLTATELDGNFHEAEDRIVVLETEGPLGIQSIDATDDGSTLTVTLTDDTTQGPFPLPVAAMRPAGSWTNSTPYAYLDLVTVEGQGTFLVLQPHTTPAAPAEFDPEAGDSDGDFYFPMSVAVDVDNDVAFSFKGTLPESASEGTDAGTDTDTEGSADDVLIGQYIIIRNLVMSAPLSLGAAYLNTPPSVSEVTLLITKNGTEIGNIVFDIDDNFGTITFPDDVEFSRPDRLAIVVAGADGIAADLSVTLPMRRTDL